MSATASREHRVATAVAGVIGNVMEWYDFALYGYFASTIGKQFFPAEDAAASLIASFGVFAAGFLMRPIGAALFGQIRLHLPLDAMRRTVPHSVAMPDHVETFLGHGPPAALHCDETRRYPSQSLPARQGNEPDGGRMRGGDGA